MKELSVSIVLFNNDIELVKDIISCCTQDIDQSDIYIIDHSSKKINYNKVFTNSKVNYYKSENTGFGSGHNKAITKFKIIDRYKYHLILNPDIKFKKNTLKKLLKYLNLNTDIGALMPKITNFDGTLQYSRRCLPSISYLLMKRLFPNSKHAIEYELKNAEPTKPVELIAICGCFMMLNLKILKKVKIFDENFFMYFEDFDLARRISLYSKVIYYPLVEVAHEGQREHRKSLKLLYYLLRSSFIYFQKWGYFDNYRDKKNKETLKHFSKFKF